MYSSVMLLCDLYKYHCLRIVIHNHVLRIIITFCNECRTDFCTYTIKCTLNTYCNIVLRNITYNSQASKLTHCVINHIYKLYMTTTQELWYDMKSLQDFDKDLTEYNIQYNYTL